MTRSIQIPASVWKLVVALRPAKASTEDPVFRSRKKKAGGRLQPLAILRIVRAAAQRAGIEVGGFAALVRHAHASHALDRAPDSLGVSHPGACQHQHGRYLHARPNDSSSLSSPG